MHWHFKPDAPFFILDPEGDGLTYFETAAERDAAAGDLPAMIRALNDLQAYSE